MVLTIVVVAVSIFSQTMVATSKLRKTNRESAIAAEGARIVLEEMRGVPFPEVFARFNADPKDDPFGTGTAPGDRFVVDGLKPLGEKEQDIWVGRIIFPTRGRSEAIDDPPPDPPREGTTDPLGGMCPDPLKMPDKMQLPPLPTALPGLGLGDEGIGDDGGGILGPPDDPQAPDPNDPGALREDCVYPELGMPRDLNGDSIIDGEDHADDYYILPVHIVLEWAGGNGKRRFDLHSVFTEVRK